VRFVGQTDDIAALRFFKVCLNARGAQSRSAIRTHVPFRLDRLPWSRFHVPVVVGLGIT
jgi:hypothetical protein